VKTGTDSQAVDVELGKVVSATIAAMTAIPAPPDPTARVARTEKTVFSEQWPEQLGRLAHRRVVDAGRLDQQDHTGGHQLAKMGLTGGGVLPVDAGLRSAEGLGRGACLLAQALAGNPHHLAQEAPNQFVGVGHRPRPVHGRGIDAATSTTPG